MNWQALSLCALLALVPSVATGGGTCSGVKGGCGRSAYSRSSRSSFSGGTVHVSGHYRKDGTYVRPHTRRPPGTATMDYPSAPVVASVEPRTTPRTASRTTARTTAWNGNVTEHDDEATVIRPVPTPIPEQELRRWTNKSGRYSVIARFGGMIGATVTLHKIDGTTITIELEQLCDSDQDWILARRK